MVDKVTEREQPRFITQIEEILATITGPRREFEIIAGRTVQMDFSWFIRNPGDVLSVASLKLNLLTDGFFGDSSELRVEQDGSFTGRLAGSAQVSGNFPKTIAAGGSDTLFMSVRVPSQVIFDRQEAKSGFSWWVAELTAFDVTNNEVAGGDSIFEIRDFFRLTGAPVPIPVVAPVDAVGVPAFEVMQIA